MADEEESPAGKLPKKPRKSARASVSVEGDVPPETVGDVLAAASKAKDPATATAPRPPRFEAAVKNPLYRIIAKRLSPEQTDDGTPLQDSYELMPHSDMTAEEIKRELSENRGGRRWNVRVYDEEDKALVALTINVPGAPRADPTLAEMDAPSGSGGREMEQEEELETVEQKIANDPDVVEAQKKNRLLRIQIEREEGEAGLADIRARRAASEKAARGETAGTGNGHPLRTADEERMEKMLAPMKQQNELLQKQLDEANRKSEMREAKQDRKEELEAIVGPLKAAQDTQAKLLETLTTKLNQPPVQQGPSFESQMKELRRDWKDDMQAFVTSQLAGVTTKIDALAQTVTLIGQGKGSDPATAALINLATKPASGGAGPGDPFTNMSKMLEVMKAMQGMTTTPTATGETTPPDFPSYLVSKMCDMTPEVLNFIERTKLAGGAVPSKEDVENMIRQNAVKMYEGINGELKNGIGKVYTSVNNRLTRAGIPGAPEQGKPPPAAPPVVQPAPGPHPLPGGQAAAVAPAPGAPVPVSQQGAVPLPAVVDFPGAPAPAGAPAAPAPPAKEGSVAPPTSAPLAEAQPVGVRLTPSQLAASLATKDFAEYKKRVDFVLKGMHREMQVGARAMQWPKMALDNLPRAIINQLVEAATDEDIEQIVKPYGDAALLREIWAFVSDEHAEHEFYRQWLSEGINWIKEAEGAVPTDEEAPAAEEEFEPPPE